ncbi:MAG: FHA domain-containing protein, partial [Candidatus Aminicenantes bacterium]|nr:FHA domain-containing protein [Candidatus Aminicenantes bacterium]
MKYLLYYNNGFVKKFPLTKPILTVGRGNHNDLIIEDDFLSRDHLRIQVENDYITIKDLESTNGTLVDHQPVSEARINFDESFTLGGIEFYLKEGSIKEFKAVKELVPIFSKIKNQLEQGFGSSETRYIQDIYHETLKQVLQTGLKKNDFTKFISDLSGYLSNLPAPGSFIMVSKQNRDFNLLFSVKNKPEFLEALKEILHGKQKLFSKELLSVKIPRKKSCFWSYPIKTGDEVCSLIYISNSSESEKNQKIEKFLYTLSKEISLISQLLFEKKSNHKECLSADMDSGLQIDCPVDIVAASHKVQELILQSKKIAQSDLFI